MKRKSTIGILLMFVMLLCTTPAVQASTPAAETKEERIEHIEQRLEEIRAMDFKELSKAERKALRGEVRELKKEMKALSGGVYISVGAILLIALLIILLA